MPSDFNPDVVAAASGDDAEALAWCEARGHSEVVLHGADVVERLARFGRQQLVEHPFHRVEGERARCQLELARGSDHVRAFARMEDESVPIGANDRGQ